MRLIELMAQGLRFIKISKELGFAKQTLINWNMDLKEEIKILKSKRLEEVLQRNMLCEEHRSGIPTPHK